MKVFLHSTQLKERFSDQENDLPLQIKLAAVSFEQRSFTTRTLFAANLIF